MFFLGGLLGGLAGSALGGGMLRGLIASKMGNSGSASSGGAAVSGSENNQPVQQGAPPKKKPAQATQSEAAASTNAPQEPASVQPFVNEQADAIKQVNTQARNAPQSPLTELYDQKGAKIGKEPDMPSSPVAGPQGFANEGEGTAPTATPEENQFGAQPLPPGEQGPLDQLLEPPPRIITEQQTGFPNKPLVFDQAQFPMWNGGPAPTSQPGAYAPQLRYGRG